MPLAYGYVHFFNEGVAEEVIEQTEDHPILLRRRALRLELGDLPPKFKKPSRSLYIGNIPKFVTRGDLLSTFKDLCVIADCRMSRYQYVLCTA